MGKSDMPQSQILIYLAIIIGVPVIWCLYNWTKRRQIQNYYNLYVEYLNNPSFEMAKHEVQIIELFKLAGLKDSGYMFERYIEAGVGGYLQPINTSLFDNILTRKDDIIPRVKQLFNSAIGVFEYRMRQSYNPFFWIESFIFLPTRTLQYIGLIKGGINIRIIQVIYWLIMAFVALWKIGVIPNFVN